MKTLLKQLLLAKTAVFALIIGLLMFMIFIGGSIQTRAAALTVTKIEDTNDGTCSDDCSLREAIAVAEPGDTIQFAPLFDSPQTITLADNLGQLIIRKGLTIIGKGAHLLTIRRSPGATVKFRIFSIESLTSDPIVVNLSGMTIAGGDLRGVTGAFGAGDGGAIQIVQSKTTITESHITGNAAVIGGAIDTFSGTLTILNSTISNNTAVAKSGGIHNLNRGGMIVINTTISGNVVTGNSCCSGGGIYSDGLGVVITGSTITDNAVTNGDGSASGVLDESSSSRTMTIRNSIIAGNRNVSTAPDFRENLEIVSQGYNLIGSFQGFRNGFNKPTDQVGTVGAPLNPRLDPLANYGGTTPTHRLQSSSPAIDKGNSFGLTTDQRGSVRPVDDPNIPPATGGDNSDIGAFELSGGNSAPNTPMGNNVTVQSSSNDARVTFTSVSQPGNTTFTPINPPSSAGSPPQGYTILNNAPGYDITTTAVYTPPVTVCFTVSSITNEAEFARVRILHGEGGQLIDRTILSPDNPAPDFATRRVCARVDSLSPFVTALAPGSPTAASVTIGGRIMTTTGRGIRNVRLTLTDSAGETRLAVSNAFGYYRFVDVPAGETFVIGASGKRFIFDNPTRVLNVAEETENIDFIALPQK